MRRARGPLARQTKRRFILVRCIECDWHRSVARLYAERMFSGQRVTRSLVAAAAFRIAERHDGLRTGIKVPNYGRLYKDLQPHQSPTWAGWTRRSAATGSGEEIGRALLPQVRLGGQWHHRGRGAQGRETASPSRLDRGRRLPPADAGRGRERQEPDPPLRDLRHDSRRWSDDGGGSHLGGIDAPLRRSKAENQESCSEQAGGGAIGDGGDSRGESRSPTTTASAASTCSARRRSSGTTSRPRQPHDPPHDPTWAEALPRRASADARGDPLGNDGDGRRRGAPSRARSSGETSVVQPDLVTDSAVRCPAERRVGEVLLLLRPPGRAVRRGVL